MSKAKDTYKKNSFNSAADYFNKSIEYWPYDFTAHATLGKIYLNMGMYEKSERVLLNSLKYFPYNDFTYNNLGILHENKGEFYNALACYDKAISIYPHSFESLYNKWKLLRKLGKEKQAEDIAKTILSIEPRYARAFLVRGLIRKNYNKFNEALEDLIAANGKDL